MERRECCKIILENANKWRADASSIANEIKEGKRTEADASSLVMVVNSWKLLPNKCRECIEREKFMQNSIKKTQNKKGYRYEY